MRNLQVVLLIMLAAGLVESASVVRLTGGQRYQGLVEMNINNQWRPVCKMFGDYKPTADIVCRMLGYRYAKDYYYVKVNNQSGSVKPSTGVQCTGRESHISKCPSIDCDDDFRYKMQLGVICHNNKALPNGNIRLRGGPTANQGLAEIQIYGVWAGICQIDFTSREADVFCRSLNYKGALSFRTVFRDKTSMYVPRYDRVYACKGDETDVSQCSRKVPPEFCMEGRLNITCDNYAGDLQVRLAGGSQPFYGNLEIKFNNTWGSICQNRWLRGIDNICQMLNYPLGAVTSYPSYKPSQKKIWLTSVNCPSSATKIEQCSRDSEWGKSSCSKDWTAGLICIEPKVNHLQVAVKLVGGRTHDEGRVQVRYKGAWGSLLAVTYFFKNSSYYVNRADEVLCRMMEYKKADRKKTVYRYTNIAGPRLLTGLACIGDEKTIEQCRHNKWGNDRTHHSYEIYVSCL